MSKRKTIEYGWVRGWITSAEGVRSRCWRYYTSGLCTGTITYYPKSDVIRLMLVPYDNEDDGIILLTNKRHLLIARALIETW